MSDEDDVDDQQVSEVVVVERALAKAVTMFSKLQTEDGFWPADYGGPLFLLPALVRFLDHSYILYFYLYIHMHG